MIQQNTVTLSIHLPHVAQLSKDDNMVKTRMALQNNSFIGSLLLLCCMFSAGAVSAEEMVDASDPTKVYTYAGGGIKYTDYTNGESMTEVRATGNFGLSESDMVMFELGYGWHDGNRVPGGNSDWTNARGRWFHLFNMDYSVERGYRGWATQVDLQLAGSLKGTDGQNVGSVGGVASYGLAPGWSGFLMLNLVNSWDKGWDNHNGAGFGFSPLLVYGPDNWWEGAYVQLWPTWTHFFSGQLDGEGSFNIDIITGGNITPTLVWSATYQSNHNLDLSTFRRGRDTGLKNDWNLFFNLTTYF